MKVRLTAIGLAVLLVGCGAPPPIQPAPRYGTAAAVVDGRVYVAGGMESRSDGDVVVATLEAYDPARRTWTACAPMPTARGFAAAAARDGRLYVFGGLDDDGAPLDAAEAYDPDADVWTACPPLPAARSRLAAARHGDGLLAAGGISAGGDSQDVHYFVPEENAWRDWVPLPTPRHALALAGANDDTERVFAVGGYGADGALADVDLFGPSGGTYVWRPVPPLAEARGFFGLARIGRKLYAVGGRVRDIPSTEVLDMDGCDDADAQWEAAAPLPKDLCRFSLVAWNGRLLAFGGETEYGMAVNTDVLEYDPAADAWTVR